MWPWPRWLIRLFVVSARMRDLLFRAKHLVFAAMVVAGAAIARSSHDHQFMHGSGFLSLWGGEGRHDTV
jgi:hypothetical protein